MSKVKAAGLTSSLVQPGLVAGKGGLVAKGEAQAVHAAAPVSPRVAHTALASFRTETEAQEGRIVRVPIHLVHDNPYNARRLYSQETVKERATSIAAEGQKVAAAAIAHPDKPGEFQLIDGKYRKLALIYLGRTEIDLRIENVKSAKDMYRLSRLYNKQRDDGSALDDALVWSQMLADGAVESGDDLAEAAGVSKSVVSKTLGILKLPEVAIQRIHEVPQAVGSAMGYELYLLSKVVPEARLMQVLERVMKGELNTKDLEAMRTRLATGQRRKVKELSRQYRIKDGDAQIGVLKEWDSGKVMFEVKLLDPKTRADLVEELKLRFGLNAAASQLELSGSDG